MSKKIYCNIIIIFTIVLCGIIMLAMEVNSKSFKQTDIARLETLNEEIKQWKFYNIKEDYNAASAKKKKIKKLLEELEKKNIISSEEKIKLSKGEDIIIAEQNVNIREFVSEAGEELDVLRDNIGRIIGIKISDGETSEIPIPYGFYYVGGKARTGVVISDNEEDSNRYYGEDFVGTDLIGNQFVWVFIDYNILKCNDKSKSFEVKGIESNMLSNSIKQYKGMYIQRNIKNDESSIEEYENVSNVSIERINVDNSNNNIIWLDTARMNSLPNLEEKILNYNDIMYINR